MEVVRYPFGGDGMAGVIPSLTASNEIGGSERMSTSFLCPVLRAISCTNLETKNI